MQVTNVYIYYLIIIIVMIILYIYIEEGKKPLYKDIIAIISSSSIILVLIHFIQTNINTENNNYTKYVNSLIMNFDQLYLQYPQQLEKLFYEIYYNIQSDNKVTNIEFAVINIIINDINNLYINNSDFLKEQRVQNQLILFTRSNKFRTVFQIIKKNFSSEFIQTLKDNNIFT
jgi:hypothetical protein